ncbi:MAG: hypothetical protein EXR49_05605 [Dehalococcoidia bacterium]|nr:hypothetical protein [Dehalococcoidia bacterium]
MPQMPGLLTLCADHTIDAETAALAVKAGFLVSAGAGNIPLPGKAFRPKRRPAGGIILTRDRRLWEERALPLARTAGLVLLDVPPSDPQAVADALAFVERIFGRHYTHERWHGMKVLARPDGCTIKTPTPDGSAAERNISWDNGLLFVRQAVAMERSTLAARAAP